MEHLVDLDALAALLAAPVESWRLRATVGPLRWRDERAPWPPPIGTDRAGVVMPESLSIRVSREPDGELEIVVWTGGWADVDLLIGDDVVSRCPRFTDVDGARTAVVRTVERFLAARRVDRTPAEDGSVSRDR
ncbi:hypothetical protein FHR81_001795 [Actinoalloteichus hoggarensis]|uniref:Uncharacterized protein n=1 Tax=Actinoalloteichus hoggarensis TaxID=1470176 RepID=A0A221W5P5_9PSEU|nr:hypothetical protein [Actinoalloteichus hoggarensis]ASO20827.1 hypothetical protein AHOG_16005 [Actinoalloteichus hoggarensis]MBB5920757.1 hypothetical protein [Actinoalloteichus hoggarensis]